MKEPQGRSLLLAVMLATALSGAAVAENAVLKGTYLFNDGFTAEEATASDLVPVDPLGLNGVWLATITYVGWRFYERLRMYSIVQQGAVLFLLVLAGESARLLVQDLAYGRGWSWGVLFPAVTSLLLWPFLYLLLSRLKFRVGVD